MLPGCSDFEVPCGYLLVASPEKIWLAVLPVGAFPLRGISHQMGASIRMFNMAQEAPTFSAASGSVS